MSTSFRSGHLRRLAGLMMLTCVSSCAGDGAPDPSVQRPHLPSPGPEFGQPVSKPVLQNGGDMRAFAAQQDKVIEVQNKRLVGDGAFYADVQRKFGAK